MKAVKYVGNLSRYEVLYNGVPHIFSEANNFILYFDDNFADELVKKDNNFEIVNQDKDIKQEAKENEVINEKKEEKKKRKEE